MVYKTKSGAFRRKSSSSKLWRRHRRWRGRRRGGIAIEPQPPTGYGGFQDSLLRHRLACKARLARAHRDAVIRPVSARHRRRRARTTRSSGADLEHTWQPPVRPGISAFAVRGFPSQTQGSSGSSSAVGSAIESPGSAAADGRAAGLPPVRVPGRGSRIRPKRTDPCRSAC